MNRDFKGIWIPRQLIKELGIKNAVLVSMLYFRPPDLTVEHIRIGKQKNYIIKQNVSSEYIADIIKQKIFTGQGFGVKVCEWCEIHTLTLHKHHFPIEARHGGTHIVNICPNCHQEFHSLKEIYSFQLIGQLRGYYE